jgi:hypothetical protein
MDFLDKIINKFFENIKRRQRKRIIQDMRKKDPDLAHKLDKINEANKELNDYLRENFGDHLKKSKEK